MTTRRRSNRELSMALVEELEPVRRLALHEYIEVGRTWKREDYRAARKYLKDAVEKVTNPWNPWRGAEGDDATEAD